MFDFPEADKASKVPSRKPAPSTLRTKFGKNITRLRRAKGLTQESLAEKVGLSVRYVQSIEAGEYFPTLPTLTRLRRTLSTDWNEIFDGCDS